MENIEENNVAIEEIIEDNVEPIVDKNKDFTNQLQKPKKPRTQKQIDALKKAQETRKKNIEARKIKKQNDNNYIEEKQINPSNNGMNEDFDAKELIKQHEEQLRKLALSKVKKKPKKKKVIYQEPDDSSSSEEEIIYIPKSKKKKKKKKVIVHQSSSSSEEEEVEQQNVPSYFSKPKLRYSDVFRFQ